MLYLKSDLNVAECIKFCNAIIYIYNQTHFDKKFILRWCKNTVHWNRSRCTSKAYRMNSRMLFSHPEYCNIANALILNWNENFNNFIVHLIISQIYSGRCIFITVTEPRMYELLSANQWITLKNIEITRWFMHTLKIISANQ